MPDIPPPKFNADDYINSPSLDKAKREATEALSKFDGRITSYKNIHEKILTLCDSIKPVQSVKARLGDDEDQLKNKFRQYVLDNLIAIKKDEKVDPSLIIQNLFIDNIHGNDWKASCGNCENLQKLYVIQKDVVTNKGPYQANILAGTIFQHNGSPKTSTAPSIDQGNSQKKETGKFIKS